MSEHVDAQLTQLDTIEEILVSIARLCVKLTAYSRAYAALSTQGGFALQYLVGKLVKQFTGAAAILTQAIDGLRDHDAL